MSELDRTDLQLVGALRTLEASLELRTLSVDRLPTLATDDGGIRLDIGVAHRTPFFVDKHVSHPLPWGDLN